ncbi:hypothetical protein FKM82_027922 [Ascaphus truei]
MRVTVQTWHLLNAFSLQNPPLVTLKIKMKGVSGIAVWLRSPVLYCGFPFRFQLKILHQNISRQHLLRWSLEHQFQAAVTQTVYIGSGLLVFLLLQHFHR